VVEIIKRFNCETFHAITKRWNTIAAVVSVISVSSVQSIISNN